MTVTPTNPRDVAEGFHLFIARSALAETTVTKYTAYVNQFCGWLAEQGPEYTGALTDEWIRDYAVTDWRRTLVDKGLSASTVDLAVTAVGQMYRHLGMQPPRVKHTHAKLRTAPKALSVDEQRWVLRAAQQRGPRDLALVQLGLGAGLRVGEIITLDVFDLRILERKGTVEVRHGKGGKRRQVPLNRPVRETMTAWMAERQRWGADTDAVFLSRGGKVRRPGRISDRTVQHIVKQVGEKAGLKEPLSPHILRHTCARTMIETGSDLVTVQRVLGHSSVTTTSIYTQPTPEYIADALEATAVDY